MIKDKSEQEQPRLEIDLTGPDGNVFALMNYAAQYAKQLGIDGKAIREEMMSGDYENAVQAFDQYFGEYITLFR